jgi:hypothetical protein
LPAALVELGRPAIGVAGNSLSGFKSAVVFQKICDAGRPKRVRRSGVGAHSPVRRDSFPVLPKAAGNKGEPGSLPRPVALRYSSRSSSSLWCTGSSFSLPPFHCSRRHSGQGNKSITLDGVLGQASINNTVVVAGTGNVTINGGSQKPTFNPHANIPSVVVGLPQIGRPATGGLIAVGDAHGNESITLDGVSGGITCHATGTPAGHFETTTGPGIIASSTSAEGGRRVYVLRSLQLIYPSASVRLGTLRDEISVSGVSSDLLSVLGRATIPERS